MEELILVAEDEKEMNRMICDYLEAVGFRTLSARDGSEALELFRSKEPALVLLDIMMPRLDGIDVTRRIRSQSNTPVIMLTAMAEEGDKLMGLEIGADDYITKPFSMKELAARIRAVLRRTAAFSPTPAEGEEKAPLTEGDLVLDRLKMLLYKKGKTVELTAVQYAILEKMMASPGRVFNRMDLLTSFQADPWEGYERTIDVHIKNIRKLTEEDPSHPEYIETVWGVGYRFREKS
ncbi:MAG: response regulator transcription factor [Spirochaetales bacterium]|nr:response regulator transcription factor [Spirochaetales bacterium]